MSYPQATTRRETALAAQGQRCGHIDGKRRCGVYVIGEELLISPEVPENMRSDYRNQRERLFVQWGYEVGYQIGASGEELPDAIREHELPDHL